MEGTGLQSLTAAIQETQYPEMTSVSDLCVVSETPVSATPNDGHGLHGMTGEELHAAIQRAATGMETNYAVWKVTQRGDSLDRAHTFMKRLLDLARIQPKEQA